jgi:hypothetical protein
MLNCIAPNDRIRDLRSVERSGDPPHSIFDLLHGSLNPFPQGIAGVFDFNHIV